MAARTAPIAARFDKKLARGLDGRRGLAARLAGWAAAQRDTRRPLVWMHAPSVGEGLQAKPVLETLRFQFTKEPEYYRKDDHQGVNSVLVVEGLPEKDRGTGGFEFAKVLEVHDGPSVLQPLAGLACKMETA